MFLFNEKEISISHKQYQNLCLLDTEGEKKEILKLIQTISLEKKLNKKLNEQKKGTHFKI